VAKTHTLGCVVTRRQALGIIGAAGAVSFVALGSASRAWAACAVPPSQTEGPYFVDELLQRSDITVDPSDGSVQPGVPLRLRINVLRADAGCAPAPGLQVDVWHASASGLYSDEAAIGTVGRKYLRGYQTTDANGAVEFTTVYPGWYTGRTIHIHFKVRAFDGTQITYEFTSQLYFDDAVSDQVMALAPYGTRGARDTTNASDGIFNGTTALLLALTDDGNGGYVGTFDAGLTGLPTTTGTTACADLADCRAVLTAALPDPAVAASRRSRKVARLLVRLNVRAGSLLDRAGAVSGTKQTRLYTRASAVLQRLMDLATQAASAGTLGVSLAPITQASAAILALVPSA